MPTASALAHPRAVDPSAVCGSVVEPPPRLALQGPPAASLSHRRTCRPLRRSCYGGSYKKLAQSTHIVLGRLIDGCGAPNTWLGRPFSSRATSPFGHRPILGRPAHALGAAASRRVAALRGIARGGSGAVLEDPVGLLPVGARRPYCAWVSDRRLPATGRGPPRSVLFFSRSGAAVLASVVLAVASADPGPAPARPRRGRQTPPRPRRPPPRAKGHDRSCRAPFTRLSGSPRPTAATAPPGRRGTGPRSARQRPAATGRVARPPRAADLPLLRRALGAAAAPDGLPEPDDPGRLVSLNAAEARTCARSQLPGGAARQRRLAVGKQKATAHRHT